MPEIRTRKPLRINPTTFKPTFLSIPPSPCSPRTPITPFLSTNKSPASPYSPISNDYFPKDDSDVPSSPLTWVWQCHQCQRSYHLGVTRRCLEDGHQFCSGTTKVKTWRKPALQRRQTRRHRACASEFDYQGWKAWGRWRRGGASNNTLNNTGRESKVSVSKKDCWNTCDYPSECRWAKKFGIHTPTPSTSTFPVLDICSSPIIPDAAPKSPGEGVLKSENVVGLEQDKADFWCALMASAKRRKSSSASSPLASVAEEDEEDEDGDTVISSSCSSSDSSPNTTPTKAVSVAAMDMLKDFMKRKTARKERKVANRAHKYNMDVPGLTVPKSITMHKGDNQMSLSEGEKFLEGFEPLQRVRSRKNLVSLGTFGGQ